MMISFPQTFDRIVFYCISLLLLVFIVNFITTNRIEKRNRSKVLYRELSGFGLVNIPCHTILSFGKGNPQSTLAPIPFILLSHLYGRIWSRGRKHNLRLDKDFTHLQKVNISSLLLIPWCIFVYVYVCACVELP